MVAVSTFQQNLHYLHVYGRRKGMQFVLVVQDIALNREKLAPDRILIVWPSDINTTMTSLAPTSSMRLIDELMSFMVS